MITREQLSEEQESALQYMITFLKSKDRQMLLAGFAGTGKTVLVNVFLEHIKHKTSYVSICTAPTNEAVRVLSKATGEKYDKTIYSLLGLALVHEDDKDPILKTIGTPKMGEYDIIVIDEASMIDSYLLELIQEQLNKHSYIKVIYVGDDAQLPPIKDVQDGLKQSKVFELENQVILREVQRVTKGNPIINVVTPIRNNLLSAEDKFERKTVMNGEHGVSFHDNRNDYMEMLYNDFTSDAYKKDNNYVRAIAYTNKAINALNIHIRRKLFNSTNLPDYVEGENLIVDSPVVDKITKKISKIIYTVGERLRVKSVNQFTDAEYGYRVWELRVVNYEEEKSNQVTKTLRVIHKDDMNAYYLCLSELAGNAKEKLTKKMMKNGKEHNIYTRYEAWKEYFEFKNQYSWVKYSYAMTTHKCVHPDTIINIGNSSKRMKSIVPAMLVTGADKNMHDVNYKSITHHDKYAIVTLKTGQVLKCGIDHPIKVLNELDDQYVKASDLTNSDRVCVQLGESVNNDVSSYIKLPDFIPNQTDIKSKSFNQLTEMLAWALGALIGGGSYIYENNRVDYMAPDDLDLLEKMISMFNEHGIFPQIIEKDDRPFIIAIDSINVRSILDYFGFGRESNSYKKLYDPIISLSNYYLKYVLSGLFDSSGNISDKNKINFMSLSHELILNVQTMLLRFGIISSISKQNSRYYILQISGKYISIFKKNIGFTSHRNSVRLDMINIDNKYNDDIMVDEYNNCFYTPVKSVKIVNESIDLMEIDVDSSHTYIANGIVTHNSQGSTVERVYVIERDLNRLTWNDEERNKLKYVAFTRASHVLRILQ